MTPELPGLPLAPIPTAFTAPTLPVAPDGGTHPDHAPVQAFPFFHVAVVAPSGFSAPGLADLLARRLWGMLARKSREPGVCLYAVVGEPVCRAACEAADRFGWRMVGVGGPTVFRANVKLAADCNAVVVVHGGDPGPQLRWLAGEACRRMGTPVREVLV